MIGATESIHFTPEELAMLFGLKADAVFNLVLPLDAWHNQFHAALAVLNAERQEIESRINVPGVTGLEVHSYLSKSEFLALRPRMLIVNTLATSLLDGARRNYKETRDALDGLQKVLKEKLGLVHRLEFKEDKSKSGKERSQ